MTTFVTKTPTLSDRKDVARCMGWERVERSPDGLLGYKPENDEGFSQLETIPEYYSDYTTIPEMLAHLRDKMVHPILNFAPDYVVYRIALGALCVNDPIRVHLGVFRIAKDIPMALANLVRAAEKLERI